MDSKLHGITVILYDKRKVGTDAFKRPVYEDEPIEVKNVLVGEPTSQEIVDVLSLTGKRLAYTLGIPKDDTNVWTDRKVEIEGEMFHVIGKPTKGIDSLIPLDWNKKVQVEHIE